MYHSIVKRTVRGAFEAVNRHDYSALLGVCRPDIVHRFGGDHALGGTRRDRNAMHAWFERLGRVIPTLRLNIRDVWVKGAPWNTVAFVRWDAEGELLDGGRYRNHGVHVVEMRWGKVASIDANEDSQAVADMLSRQAEAGVDEALAPAIES